MQSHNYNYHPSYFARGTLIGAKEDDIAALLVDLVHPGGPGAAAALLGKHQVALAEDASLLRHPGLLDPGVVLDLVQGLLEVLVQFAIAEQGLGALPVREEEGVLEKETELN